MSTEKTDSRFLNVRMTLCDVLYISYALPSGRLRTLVPGILSPSTIDGETAFISIVVLKSTHVRLNLFPFVHFNYYQLNIRTYVKDPVSGGNAVYFIKSGVTSRFISLVTRMSGIPWQYIDLKTGIPIDEGTNSYTVSGRWQGKYHITAGNQPAEPGPLPFFSSRKEAVDFLIRPLIGFVGDQRGLGRFTIWHPEVGLEVWRLKELDFPLFTTLGAVDEPCHPHSVFFLPAADFSIFLPPARIR
jgi:hypothetical protein